MGTATRVPQRSEVAAVEAELEVEGEELSAEEAWSALRRYGGWSLVRDSFIRFRYADGFSHSRALALQTVLSIVPLAIALIGLSGVLHTEDVGRIAELTIRRLRRAGPARTWWTTLWRRATTGPGTAARSPSGSACSSQW